MCGEYGMHYIRALQEGPDSRYLRAIATAKHFADYDQEGNFGTDRSRWGVVQCANPAHTVHQPHRQSFNAVVSLRDQAEYFLPSFRAAVQGGQARSLMW